LSDHLSQVHGLSSEERQPWLKSAMFSNTKLLPSLPLYPFWSMPYTAMSMNSSLPQPAKTRMKQPESTRMKQPKTNIKVCLETKVYPEFKFNHMFSMLVVGPSQCGKTYFVEELLTKPCVNYPNKKQRKIQWFYNQQQPRYAALQRTLKDEIQFTQGLPELSDDLREINPKFNNVLVFDDLMAQATDSPVLSKLFTQGRHRNASVILLLQNMFPKGKFNTDISRNAQYLVLFRSPSDRKQINIIAERIFAKDRSKFMEIYAKETAKPYGYVLIDNQPKTAPDKQVVSSVFDECRRYPSICANAESSREAVVIPEKRKDDFESPAAKKPKRENLTQTRVVKKSQKSQPKKQTSKRTKQKPKRQAKKPTKKPKSQSKPKKQAKTPKYHNSKAISDHEFNFENVDNSLSSDDNEMSTSFEYSEHLTEEQLNELARQDHLRRGVGPRYVY